MAKTENIKYIRLSTGEELVGEVTSDSGEVVTIREPVRILVIPTQDQNNPRVAFGPFAQWVEDKELTLNKKHVTIIATPITEFINQYNAMFSGLVLPKSEIIKP